MNKQLSKYIAICFFLCIILFFPYISINAIKLSFELTTLVLLPAIFPSMIISQIILNEGLLQFNSVINQAENRPFINFSSYFLPLIFLCILAGVPSSAMILDVEYKKGLLNDKQFLWLAILTSNTSLSFVINYLTTVEQNIPLVLIIFLFYFPALFNSLIFLLHNKTDIIHTYKQANGNKKMLSLNQIFINCIKSMCYVFIYLSISLMIINVIKYTIKSTYLLYIFSSFIEITSSCNMIKTLPFSMSKVLFFIITISFGGLCSILQMNSVITNNNISLFTLIIIKMLNALTALSIFLLYILYHLFTQ